MATYKLIASSTVGAGGASSIDFTNIPQTYTDLVILLSVRNNYNGQPPVGLLTINGSTASFSNRDVFGTGSSTVSQTNNSRGPFFEGDSWTANTFSSTTVYIPNYTSSNNKSISTESVSENNGTDAYAQMNAILWSNTAAITSISFGMSLGTSFKQYTTAYLYGISNA